MASDQNDLASVLTERLESLVVVIRDHSVRPLFVVVRYVILGLFGLALALTALTVSVIGLMALFDRDVFPGRVWATYFLFGTVLVLGGVTLFRGARPRPEQ